jgi:hypothetical protein
MRFHLSSQEFQISLWKIAGNGIAAEDDFLQKMSASNARSRKPRLE